MGRMWTPQRPGVRLAPPGFVKQPRIAGSPNYVEDHPTRYDWDPHVEPMIRKIYRVIGGPENGHLNTYEFHPPLNPAANIWRNYKTLSADLWGPGGRGDHVIPRIAEQALRVVWNDPGEPFLWYYIYQGTIYNRFINDFEPRFFASPDDPFAYHGDHVHWSWLFPGGVWR